MALDVVAKYLLAKARCARILLLQVPMQGPDNEPGPIAHQTRRRPPTPHPPTPACQLVLPTFAPPGLMLPRSIGPIGAHARGGTASLTGACLGRPKGPAQFQGSFRTAPPGREGGAAVSHSVVYEIRVLYVLFSVCGLEGHMHALTVYKSAIDSCERPRHRCLRSSAGLNPPT